MRRLLRLACLVAIALAGPACPIGGNLRGIATGSQAPAPPRPETSGPLYVYACEDVDDPDAPALRAEANDRDGAVDQCVAELRRRRRNAASVSCRCRLQGNAQLLGRS